jgi:hypothetical protein
MVGGPSRGEAERVGHIILASLSGDAYRLACSDLIFLPQRLLTDEEKLRDYRLTWLAAFLSLVRPGQIRLDLLTRTDREEISRIAETFVRVPDGPRRKMVAQLFFRSMRLEEIGKTGRIPEKPISDKTRTAFLETEGRRGQQRAKAMTFLGADYWSPLTPLQAYESPREIDAHQAPQFTGRLPKRERLAQRRYHIQRTSWHFQGRSCEDRRNNSPGKTVSGAWSREARHEASGHRSAEAVS